MTFAITGANGFLGVHIIHHILREGYTVRAIIRPGASLAEYNQVKEYYKLAEEDYARLTWHECVLYDTEGLHQIFTDTQYVLHLAGVISYLEKDFPRLVEVNQLYTANVVDVARGAGVKKLLYSSSIAAISKSTKGEPIAEDTEWDNEIAHSKYGYTKHLGELELWRGMYEGLPTVAINPGIILGPGNWSKGSNKLFDNAKKGFPFYSKGVTGWVGVEDVARIAIGLCISDIVGERFTVVSENKSFKEVADLMTTAMGTKKPSIEIKGVLYKLAYAIVSVKEFLGIGGMLSKETVRASIAVNHFDNSKVKKALNFKFEKMSEVIRKSV